jgi:hypothetical protein
VAANVRGLEAVVERAMIFGAGEWIRQEDIDLPSRREDSRVDTIDRQHTFGAEGLTWLQSEALRIASSRREVRRRDLVARGHTSESVARRQLAGLVRRGLLRRIGLGRGARYVRVPCRVGGRRLSRSHARRSQGDSILLRGSCCRVPSSWAVMAPPAMTSGAALGRGMMARRSDAGRWRAARSWP